MYSGILYFEYAPAEGAGSAGALFRTGAVPVTGPTVPVHQVVDPLPLPCAVAVTWYPMYLPISSSAMT